MSGTTQGGGYFDKKGEVNELRQLLKQVSLERDDTKKRDALKKVIAYMTLGIDVSRLFSDVIMASHTSDLVQKKMIYLYLTNYAESNSDLALLAINTLQKDCRDQDPTIRGLALRSLCSLKLGNVLEYVEPACMNGLKDGSGYVRKIAILGMIKIFHLSPETVRESDEIIDKLYSLIGDPDPLVSQNSIHALDEILSDIGGITVNKVMLEYLLGRLTSYSEFGQAAVLQLLQRYCSTIEDEVAVFDVMNVLEPLLKQSSPSVVIAVTKMFLILTETKPAIQEQVVGRLKAPLLTLLATSSQELGYIVLKHIHILLGLVSGTTTTLNHWISDFKQFFPKFNDYSYVKKLKLDILVLLVTPETAESIILELRESVTDISSADIAKHAVANLGKIAGLGQNARNDEAAVNQIAGHIFHLLFELFSRLLEESSGAGNGYGFGGGGGGGDTTNTTYSTIILSEVIVVIKDLLRKYPDQFGMFQSKDLESSLESIDTLTSDGQCALLFIIGEFGNTLSHGPYLLEPLVDLIQEKSIESTKDDVVMSAGTSFAGTKDDVGNGTSADVKNHLLVAVTKLFFRRPGETAPMFRKLLKSLIIDKDVDVRDRALVYYRLCSYPDLAKRIIESPKEEVQRFAEDIREGQHSNKEFGTLSVIYGTRFTSNTIAHYKGSHVPTGNNIPRPDGGIPASKDTTPIISDPVNQNQNVGMNLANDLELLDIGRDAPAPPEQNNMQQGSAIGTMSSGTMSGGRRTDGTGIDLLDDLMDGGSPVKKESSKAVSFVPNRVLDPNRFQELWGQLDLKSTVSDKPVNTSLSEPQVVEIFKNQMNMNCIASGNADGVTKFYLYGSSGTQDWWIFELLICNGKASCTVKTTNGTEQQGNATLERIFGCIS